MIEKRIHFVVGILMVMVTLTGCPATLPDNNAPGVNNNAPGVNNNAPGVNNNAPGVNDNANSDNMNSSPIVTGKAVVGPDPVGLDGRPNMGVEGLFKPDEAWNVVSDTFIVAGFGAFVEAASVVGDQTADNVCFGYEPATMLAVDSETLRLETTYTDLGRQRDCIIDITADLPPCAVKEQVGIDQSCLLTDATGEATTNGTDVGLATPQIIKFEACTIIPDRLVVEPQWGIFNLHPIGLSLNSNPSTTGSLILIEGSRDSLTSATLTTSIDEIGNAVGCVDGMPSGTVDLIGPRLTISMLLQDGRGGVPGRPGGACTLTFDGTITYCALYEQPAAAMGSPEQTARLIRFDGTGSYETDERGGTISSMYLLFPNDGMTVSPGGGLRF